MKINLEGHIFTSLTMVVGIVYFSLIVACTRSSLSSVGKL